MTVSITVDGTDYDVPSSAADTNWAADQVAFEQAVATYLDEVGTESAASTAALATLSAAVKPTGVVGTAGSGTGITASSTNYGRHVVHKITVGFAAMDVASTTESIILWTLPAKTRVLRVIADVTSEFLGGIISAVTLKTGVTEGGEQLLLSGNVLTTPITLGALQAQLGVDLLGGTSFSTDVFWSGTVVRGSFTSVGANLSELTQGSVTFYIECCTYP